MEKTQYFISRSTNKEPWHKCVCAKEGQICKPSPRFFKGMRKGHILTLDAAFSIVILIALLGVMGYAPMMESNDPYSGLNMQRSMNDALDLLDAQGVLQQFDSNEISTAINSAMPVQYSWRMRIEKFSHANDAFTERDEINFGASDANLSGKALSHGRRLFLTFENNEIAYFYDAQYWIWVK